MLVLAWLGAALALTSVALYYAYAWGGVAALERWMRAPRRAAFALAVVLVAPAVFASGGPYGGAGRAGWPVVIVVASLAWAWSRQWLALAAARELRVVPRERERALPRSAPVAVLPGGDAALLAGLGRRRVARAGGGVLARCALARSLAFFPTALPLRPSVPLVAGFEVTAGGRRFDALDGRARDGGPALARAPLALCTLGAWRARFPERTLSAASAAPEGERELVARTGAARGVADAGALGVVRAGRWTALGPDDLERCPPWAGAVQGDESYVARWAAVARGWA